MSDKLFDKLKIVLFPKRCAICGNVIEFDKSICADCADLPVIHAPICMKCGCSKDNCICKKKRRKPEYKAVIAPFYYEDSVKQGVLNFKMNEMPKLADSYAGYISDVIKRYYELIDFDFITYIPMTKRDKINRGYNQAELLAEKIAEECGIPLKHALVKKRKNKMQKRQHAADRYVNMYNVFDIREGTDLTDSRVLLIDDVKTTGATLSSAALTLKAYGAKEVYCAVFAIVK